jgi:hypothetical protein
MRFRRRFATAGLCVWVLLAVAPQSAAQIFIHDSLDGSSCYMPIVPPGGSGTAYIYALLATGSPWSGGITGAEFRITGMPPEMIVSVTPNPVINLTLGNPFGTGCSIAFPSCQTGTPQRIVLLYTVNLTAPPRGVPHYVVEVSPHTSPSGPFQCALVTLCDVGFSKVCVSQQRSAPGPLLPLPSNPQPADAATDVATSADLAWEPTGPTSCCGIGTGFTIIYFGTSPDPPQFDMYETGERTYDPGPLAPLTTYYWRIVWTPDHDCGTRSGPVWSFTTGDKVGIETTAWQAVKAMFR